MRGVRCAGSSVCVALPRRRACVSLVSLTRGYDCAVRCLLRHLPESCCNDRRARLCVHMILVALDRPLALVLHATTVGEAHTTAGAHARSESHASAYEHACTGAYHTLVDERDMTRVAERRIRATTRTLTSSSARAALRASRMYDTSVRIALLAHSRCAYSRIILRRSEHASSVAPLLQRLREGRRRRLVVRHPRGRERTSARLCAACVRPPPAM
jgi:hypothetical protein